MHVTIPYRVEEVKLHSFLTLSTRWRKVVNFRPQPIDPRERTPTSIDYEAGWAPGLVRAFWRRKNMVIAWIWTADCPYHSLVTKTVGFLGSPRKMLGWYLNKAVITPASFKIPSNLSVYPAVLCCTISQHRNIQKTMYILLLCPLHSTLSLALLICCTKFYIVNRRQDIQQESVISPHVSS